MELFINHFSCLRPFNFIEGKCYHSSYMVKVEMYPMNTEYSAYGDMNPDFSSVVDCDLPFFNEARYNRLRKKDWEDGKIRRYISGDTTNRLKPHIIDWLENNIEDRKDKNYKKGYSYKDDSGNCETIDFELFFHRKNDALKFIKEFSLRKKPTFYFDYFKDVRNTLNDDGSYSPMD